MGRAYLVCRGAGLLLRPADESAETLESLAVEPVSKAVDALLGELWLLE